MKKIFLIAIVSVTVATGAWFLLFKEPVFHTTNGFLVNVNDQGVIIEGYDPVAYFTDNKAVMGNKQYKISYQGAAYWFASAEHASLFKMDPAQYAPQYGAFCGYAVSIGKLRPVYPAIFQIEDGRLILQHTREAYDLFNKDLAQNTIKADQNWPGIVKKHEGKPVQYDAKSSAPAITN